MEKSDPRILVVDDNKTSLMLIDEVLSEDYEVITILDPVRALDYIHSGSFDLIISGYRMPQMDGIELLQEVRQKYGKIPFIIVSAENNDENVRRAKDAGADDYMFKPLNIGTFLNTVKSNINLNNTSV